MNAKRDPGQHDDFPEPGTWRPAVTLDGRRTAFFRCPNCPTFGTLANSHEIDLVGRVTPSVVCAGCGFHEHLVLEGWADHA